MLFLLRFSDEVVWFIRDRTSTFGKAKLLLKDNNFYVESAHPGTFYSECSARVNFDNVLFD